MNMGKFHRFCSLRCEGIPGTNRKQLETRLVDQHQFKKGLLRQAEEVIDFFFNLKIRGPMKDFKLVI